MSIISSNALVTALAGREARGGFKNNNNNPRNFSISNAIGFFLFLIRIWFAFQISKLLD